MPWHQKYTISNKLLLTIREIGESIGEIKTLHLTDTALAKLELNARALSSYASTSIEGNPLPLTDVKRLLKTRQESIRDTEREVLNYNSALQALFKSVRQNRFKLNIKTLEQVQGQVADGLMDNPSHLWCAASSPRYHSQPTQTRRNCLYPARLKRCASTYRSTHGFCKSKCWEN